MQQIMSSSAGRLGRLGRSNTVSAPPDQRWHLLDLVRKCRRRLALRDRDIAVLRGLLSLLAADSGQWMVFASNRTVIDRCDGIDERTLRRRVTYLESKGLLQRKISPNRKRFQVRDENGAVQLSYGIDLEPLWQMQPHLEALAEHCDREDQRIALTRAKIRDALYHANKEIPQELAEEGRLSLRRSLPSEELEVLYAKLMKTRDLGHLPQPAAPVASVLTDSDSQNDRHIHSSNEESMIRSSDETQFVGYGDMTVGECMELAPSVRDFAPTMPKNWEDVIKLAAMLGPAIGLKPVILRDAAIRLTRHGAALAVIGLTEAFTRIRNPEAYLRTLIRNAQNGNLDLCRMYRSLVKTPCERKV